MAGQQVMLTINGEAQHFTEMLTVQQLLSFFGLDPEKVAVEHNMAIIPHSAYGETTLCHNDSLEIVHFIGGG